MPQVRGNVRYEKGNATDKRYNGGRREFCARRNGASVRYHAIGWLHAGDRPRKAVQQYIRKPELA